MMDKRVQASNLVRHHLGYSVHGQLVQWVTTGTSPRDAWLARLLEGDEVSCRGHFYYGSVAGSNEYKYLAKCKDVIAFNLPTQSWGSRSSANYWRFHQGMQGISETDRVIIQLACVAWWDSPI